MRNTIKKQAKLEQEGGFTLLGLIIILAILAVITLVASLIVPPALIVGAVAVPAFGSALHKMGDGNYDIIVARIEESAGIAYDAEGGTTNASGLKSTLAIVEKGVKDPANKGYTVDYLRKNGFLDYVGDIRGIAVLLDSGEFEFIKW